MKTHFCIPVSQQLPDALGGRYVLYSVYLDGFLFCRVRYSQLHRWNEQINKTNWVYPSSPAPPPTEFKEICEGNISLIHFGQVLKEQNQYLMKEWVKALGIEYPVQNSATVEEEDDDDENEAVPHLPATTLRRVFGNSLPPFPPKYYLAMTTSMADERRDQLEQYLQNLPMDPNVLRSDVFIDFVKQLQLSTFNITTKNTSLDIFLPDGKSIKIKILTSDTAERVLEVASQKIVLCQELLCYFGLFLIRFHKEGKLSVVKKMADFELPYVILQSSQVENCKVGLRKWYMDPSLDFMLMDCKAAVDLIYLQAIQDIEKEWAKPTQAQREKLTALQKEDNQTKFLELSREVQHYGCLQLDPCTCDYPEPGCLAVVSVGNNEISCRITLPDDQTQDVIFQMNRVKCWQVTFLGTLLDMDGPQRTLNQNLELRFQYSEDSHWQWFVIYTKQAFLLSSCLKKMISEKMVKLAAENPEMQIEVPEEGKSKRNHIQQSQWKNYSNFLPRKSKISIKVAENDCVFGTIKEEDL